MTELPDFCKEYFAVMDAHPDEFGEYQWKARARIERTFALEDLRVYMDRYTNCLKLGKNIGYYPGYPWQHIVIGLTIAVYKYDDLVKGWVPRWHWALCFMGRGAGKDIMISWLSYYFVSPYHPVKKYDVDIFAYEEKQAMRPLTSVLESLDRQKTKYRQHFHWTKELLSGKANGGTIIGHANNPKSHEGLRSGAIIYNEAHTYEKPDQLNIGKAGLGKVPDGRTYIFTTNGDVVDGPLDRFLEEGRKILDHPELPDNGKLFFIFELDSKSEVDDKRMWHKANPSLRYQPELFRKIEEHYQDWKNDPAMNSKFMTTRMNVRQSNDVNAIATVEDIKATNQPINLDLLAGQDCVVGIDLSKTDDWAAVVFHFRQGDRRFDICHAWVCLSGKELGRVKADWREWAEKGFITVVDGPEITPDMLCEYIQEMGKKYNIRKIAIDNYRYALISAALTRIGYDYESRMVHLVRPSDIYRVFPVINRCFINRFLHWGDYPPLRWGASNTCALRKKSQTVVGDNGDFGNFLYGKVEPHGRKTDTFMAFVAAMTIEEDAAEITMGTSGAADFCFSFGEVSNGKAKNESAYLLGQSEDEGRKGEDAGQKNVSSWCF